MKCDSLIELYYMALAIDRCTTLELYDDLIDGVITAKEFKKCLETVFEDDN